MQDSMPKCWRSVKFTFLASGFAGLAACAVVQSTPVGEAGPTADGRPVCISSLGYYALPKAFVQIKLTRNTGPTSVAALTNFADVNEPVKVIRKPDPVLRYCTHYSGSVLHEDTIQVLQSQPVNGVTATAVATTKTEGPTATNSSGFLGAIVVNADDQTVNIFRRLLATAFEIAKGASAGFRELDSEPAGTIFDGDFDPFDLRQSSQVNSALREHGYCMVLDGITFDPASVDPSKYCDNPTNFAKSREFYSKAYDEMSRARKEASFPGFYYRVPQPYQMIIYRKRDPGGRGPWYPEKSVWLSMENLSPVVAVGISRGAFSGKRAAFVFSDGALQNMCLAKTSEVLGAIDIPYEFVRALVQLPGQVAQLKYNRIENERKLIRIRQDIQKIHKAQLDAINAGRDYNNQTIANVGSNFPATSYPGDLGGDPPTSKEPKAGISADFKKALSDVCGSANEPVFAQP